MNGLNVFQMALLLILVAEVLYLFFYSAYYRWKELGLNSDEFLFPETEYSLCSLGDFLETGHISLKRKIWEGLMFLVTALLFLATFAGELTSGQIVGYGVLGMSFFGLPWVLPIIARALFDWSLVLFISFCVVCLCLVEKFR